MENNSLVQQQINECLVLLKKLFGSDLEGVYLYGSYLVGGLQKHSDIDLFVVLHRSSTTAEKIELTTSLLKISGIYMKSIKRCIEMTLVEKSAINPWQYPPLFNFQYGEWLRESFEQGQYEPWSSYQMPDLALIITQVLLKSHTLFGPQPEHVLAPVPFSDFMKAMLSDVDRLLADIEHDTRNVLLTCARIWSTIATHHIRSKPDAADWAIQRLPELYQPVMQRAQAICVGLEDEHWDDVHELIKPCANFMVDKINEQRASLNLQDPSASIKLA